MVDVGNAYMVEQTKSINSCRSLVSTRSVDTSTFSEMQQLMILFRII